VKWWSWVKYAYYQWFIIVYKYLYLCSVQSVLSLFASLCYFLINGLTFSNINFMFVFVLYFCFLFCVFCNFVLFSILFLRLCCLFPIFVQVYWPLPPGGNPIAVNKYHIICLSYMSCHICRIIYLIYFG